MLEVSRLMIRAALDRRETRGVHYRADHPAADPAWERHIAGRRGDEGPRYRSLAAAPGPAAAAGIA